jgi:hypothetical protein
MKESFFSCKSPKLSDPGRQEGSATHYVGSLDTPVVTGSSWWEVEERNVKDEKSQ